MTKPERLKELINLAFGLATKQVKAYNYIKLLEAYIEHLENQDIPTNEEIINNNPYTSISHKEAWYSGVIWMKKRLLK